MNVWRFHSTSQAYHETQVRDDIKFGDILIVEAEQVVGFLLSAWPIAVTEKCGRLHTRAAGGLWSSVCQRNEGELKRGHPDYLLSLEAARDEAKKLGYPLDLDGSER